MKITTSLTWILIEFQAFFLKSREYIFNSTFIHYIWMLFRFYLKTFPFRCNVSSLIGRVCPSLVIMREHACSSPRSRLFSFSSKNRWSFYRRRQPFMFKRPSETTERFNDALILRFSPIFVRTRHISNNLDRLGTTYRIFIWFLNILKLFYYNLKRFSFHV